MNIPTILEVLKNERECIKRQGTAKCDRNCKECDLCLPDDEILAVYDHLISLVETKVLIVDGSEEDKKHIVECLYKAGYSVHDDLLAEYGISKGDNE